MEKGTIKFFNNGKGFGFVTLESGGDAFLHRNQVQNSGLETRDLTDGAEVYVTTSQGKKGPQVEKIELA